MKIYDHIYLVYNNETGKYMGRSNGGIRSSTPAVHFTKEKARLAADYHFAHPEQYEVVPIRLVDSVAF